MQQILWIYLGTLCLQGVSLPGKAAIEEGRFLLFLAGKQVGWESYTHRKDGGMDVWSGEVDIHAPGMTLKQKPNLVLSADGKPVAFDLAYSTDGAENSISYKFLNDTVTVSSKGSSGESSREFPLPRNVVVLVNNVLHHDLLLARRYDWKKGGRQEFTALPNTAIALDSRGADDYLLNGNPLNLRHLFLSIGGVIGANLWLDAQERLVKMDMPLQRIEVFLEGYEKMESAIKPSPPGPKMFEALPVRFSSGEHSMAGTLTLPKTRPGPSPAVILISDTGPQNRDGDSPGEGGLKMGIFKSIAEKLSGNGFAVLRYDDRGVGKSGGSFPTASMSDFEDDARAAITYLRSRSDIEVGRIAILGYNEGALVGARIAAADPGIRALINMAGPARSGEEILNWQRRNYLSRLNLREEEIRAEEKKGLAFIDAIKKSEDDVVDIDGQNINARWFREFLTCDPLGIIKRVKCAVAVIQGGKDIQVPPEDAAALDKTLAESDNRDHELRVFPGLGHLFTESSGEGLAEMADSRKTISDEVVNYIVTFLKRKL